MATQKDVSTEQLRPSSVLKSQLLALQRFTISACHATAKCDQRLLRDSTFSIFALKQVTSFLSLNIGQRLVAFLHNILFKHFRWLDPPAYRTSFRHAKIATFRKQGPSARKEGFAFETLQKKSLLQCTQILSMKNFGQFMFSFNPTLLKQKQQLTGGYMLLIVQKTNRKQPVDRK